MDRTSRRTTAAVASLLLVLGAAACSSSQEADTQVAPGGVVTVVGSWSGAEEEAFRAMVKPFEDRTGVRVEYSGTRDLNGVLWKGVATKELPDVAGLPGPGQMRELAEIGVLRDLGEVIDVGTYKKETVPAFVEFGTVDGKLVGVFIKATLKGLIWFNPKDYTLPIPSTWDELQRRGDQAARGTTEPWCLGLESRESSGWPGTDWIEDVVLRQSGPAIYDQWVDGKLPWTSPEIRSAWEIYGQIAAEGSVDGGALGAVGLPFEDAGNALFDEPPGCIFLHQGSFMTQFFKANGGAREGEFDFFPFPQMDDRFTGAVAGGGDLFGMFNDTPAARALMRYLVSAEAQSIWVARGGALSGNVLVDDYPDALSRRAATILQEARHYRFDASDMMPEAMNDAFWKAVLEFTRDPVQLGDVLEQLDEVRIRAYAE